MTHQELLKNIVNEIASDPLVQVVIVFGSVARGDEQVRSDIDLWVIRDANDFTRRHLVRNGITVEIWQGPIEFTEKLVEQGDPPAIRVLAEGKILLDRVGIAQLVQKGHERFKAGPLPDSSERILLDRSMITGLLDDLCDAEEDPATFELLAPQLLGTACWRLFRNNNLWAVSQKQLMPEIRSRFPTFAVYVEQALPPRTPAVRLEALKWLAAFALAPIGGEVRGECLLCEIKKAR